MTYLLIELATVALMFAIAVTVAVAGSPLLAVGSVAGACILLASTGIDGDE